MSKTHLERVFPASPSEKVVSPLKKKVFANAGRREIGGETKQPAGKKTMAFLRQHFIIFSLILR